MIARLDFALITAANEDEAKNAVPTRPSVMSAIGNIVVHFRSMRIATPYSAEIWAFASRYDESRLTVNSPPIFGVKVAVIHHKQ